MKNTVEEGKSIAITSYIMVVGALIAMSMNSENKNPYASFHIRQALGLSILFVALGYTLSGFWNPMIVYPFWIFMSVLWGYGLFTAITGQTKPIPLVGGLFQKIFKNL
ncbi:hypothetical protein [Flavobacterium subsaxonicum]|uniref:Membrane protein n=1 Tax=Flavobacterium subsaxonicum WB 4.1-42 = DSM 21790 TaxID=1121898 RepID=A0A0A2MGX5_9FLAO|nr:hypothetical protein [Flavobacterium subsaxonicum]KGO91927.1 membrane protein [Flavobacterium subsaxonicum WB 4.1-42 = DSM 21790]